MKIKSCSFLIVLAVLELSALDSQLSSALAQSTAFTYQGQLQDHGSPANGTYNLQFSLLNTNTGGSAIAGPVTNNGVAVTNGLFTVTIDFGAGVWNDATNWLEISVETNGDGSFTTLTPRQQLTPAPYAIYAEGAKAAGLTGTIPMASLSGTYGGAVNLSNAGNSLSGNGAGLTGVNAATVGGLKTANFWQTGGNAGTSPTNGNFLGTTDFQPIELWVGGVRGWRLEPDPRGAQAANIIGGYISNAIEQSGSGGDFIGGGGYVGGFNIVHSNSSGVFIGAGSANQIGPNLNDAVIAGGYGNTIGGDGFRSTIGGGDSNTNDESDSFVGGGQNNFIQIDADHAFIGGGQNNSITGSYFLPVYGAIVGGYDNTIQTNVSYGFIGGGEFNTIETNAIAASIGGGAQNSVSGSYSTIPGGVNNNASGDRSFAAGDGALAADYGSFVWADASGGFFSSTASNQFSVRAEGGARFDTAGAGMTLDGQAVVASGNYVFAYSLALQTVMVPATFQDATFNNDAQANGWTHTLGSSQYFCAQAGLYLVQYTAQAHIADSMSMRGALNSIEIPGSQAYASSVNFGSAVGISKSFLASVNSGSFLTIQFTGNSPGDNLQGGGSGFFQPSISLTITRIQ